MPAPAYSVDEFTDQMLALLPRGRVWPRDLDAFIRSTVRALAPSFQRNMERGNRLLVDAFPATAEMLLVEWEKTLGLPDPCAGEAQTIPQRQAQVVARLSGMGGQSQQFFIDLAAALGYEITITVFAPSVFGMVFGGFFAGDDWAYTWQVNAALVNQQFFLFGQNNFGDPFSTWGNAVLECIFEALKPAHTVLKFSYT